MNMNFSYPVFGSFRTSHWRNQLFSYISRLFRGQRAAVTWTRRLRN